MPPIWLSPVVVRAFAVSHYSLTVRGRGKPPQHHADLTPAERRAAIEALGHKGFRARQLSTHYFERLVESPEEMTDLAQDIRDQLVAELLPTQLAAATA